jgi:predicted acyl esterase
VSPAPAKRRVISLSGALFFLAVSATAVTGPPAGAQQATPCAGSTGSFSKVTRPPVYEPGPPEIVELRSSLDGVTIQFGLIRPRVPDGLRVPVVVNASPYYHPLGSMNWWTCSSVRRIAENFVPQGYAVVALPIRGTSDSGGCMNMFGPGERADLDQVVTWLGTQPWSNGSVAMGGLSYDGSTPWMVAATGNPHLKTIYPAEGVPNIFNLLFGGGTTDWRGPAILNDIYYAQSAAFYLPGRSPQHTAEVFACPEYATGTAASIYSGLTGELDPLGYWAARDYLDKIEANYRGSVFMLQGLQDWNVNPGQQYPWINELEKKGVYVKHLLGQWGHSWPDTGPTATRRADFADMLLTWFDFWLKCDDVRVGPPLQCGESPVDLGPRVLVQDNQMGWREEAAWPPAEPSSALFLAPDGRLVDQPSQTSGSATLAPDPDHTTAASNSGAALPGASASRCGPPNCAAFATAPTPQALRIAGLPKLKLTVTPSGPGGGLSVYLYAAGESAWTRIGWGQVDLRFPNGGRQRREVQPGVPMVVDFRVQPLDAVVPAGQRLVMVVSEGSGWNRLPSTPNYPMTLQVGGTSSSLTV